MSFDPNFPAANTTASSAQMRSQFNGLKALIDAVVPVNAAQVQSVDTLPAGTPATAGVAVVGQELRFSFGLPQGTDGATGPQGPPFASAAVDSVSTLAPGSPATVSAVFDGTEVRFAFGLPRGEPGQTFGATVVDSVTTLPPGTPATVDAMFDGTNVRFTFGIPQGLVGAMGLQGAQGVPGNDGNEGPQGVPGVQGEPGEVTTAQLAAAISSAVAGTSAVSNAVATLDTPFANDPPTLADLEVMRAKFNELITALRR